VISKARVNQSQHRHTPWLMKRPQAGPAQCSVVARADHAGRGGELVIERTAKARQRVSVGTLESSPFLRKSGRGGTGAHPLIGIQAGRRRLGDPGCEFYFGYRASQVARPNAGMPFSSLISLIICAACITGAINSLPMH
jgi:hypothetical protein